MKKVIALFLFVFLMMLGVDVTAQTPGRRVVKHSNRHQNRNSNSSQNRSRSNNNSTTQKKEERTTYNYTPSSNTNSSSSSTYQGNTSRGENTSSQPNNYTEKRKIESKIEQLVQELQKKCFLRMREGITLTRISCNWRDNYYGASYRLDKEVICRFVIDKKAGDFRKNLKKRNYYVAKTELLNIFKEERIPDMYNNREHPTLIESLKRYNYIECEGDYSNSKMSLSCDFYEAGKFICNITFEPSDM